MKASEIPKATAEAIGKWNRSAKKQGSGAKTVFVRHSRGASGEELFVGYGSAPTMMTGGIGVPVGIGFSDSHYTRPGEHMGDRSYLILAFDNDYSGPELARYLGGVVKTVVDYGPGEGWAVNEDDWIAPIVTGALQVARRKGKAKP